MSNALASGRGRTPAPADSPGGAGRPSSRRGPAGPSRPCPRPVDVHAQACRAASGVPSAPPQRVCRWGVISSYSWSTPRAENTVAKRSCTRTGSVGSFSARRVRPADHPAGGQPRRRRRGRKNPFGQWSRPSRAFTPRRAAELRHHQHDGGSSSRSRWVRSSTAGRRAPGRGSPPASPCRRSCRRGCRTRPGSLRPPARRSRSAAGRRGSPRPNRESPYAACVRAAGSLSISNAPTCGESIMARASAVVSAWRVRASRPGRPARRTFDSAVQPPPTVSGPAARGGDVPFRFAGGPPGLCTWKAS